MLIDVICNKYEAQSNPRISASNFGRNCGRTLIYFDGVSFSFGV